MIYICTFVTLSRTMRLTVFSKYPLSSEAGAGLRLVKSLLENLNLVYKEVFWSNSTARPRSGLGLDSKRLFMSWREVQDLCAPPNTVLFLPDSLRDCVFFLPVLFRTKSVLVWIMDDFWEAEIREARGLRRLLKWSFSRIFMSLCPKVALISDLMLESYSRRFQLQTTYVLPPAKALSSTPLSPNLDSSRWIYMGSLKAPYIELLKGDLAKLFMKHGVHVDIYGVEAPAEDLPANVFHYCGPFQENQKGELLSRYSVGLLSYSLDNRTQNLYRLSLASKLFDYVGASLAIFYLGPDSFASQALIETHKLGICLTPKSSPGDLSERLEGFLKDLPIYQSRSKQFAQKDWFSKLKNDFLFALKD